MSYYKAKYQDYTWEYINISAIQRHAIRYGIVNTLKEANYYIRKNYTKGELAEFIKDYTKEIDKKNPYRAKCG